VVYPPELVAAADRVIQASLAAGLHVLDNAQAHDVLDQLAAGVTIIAGGYEEVARIGRRHTGRVMPE
jgi:hypothetical protein